jgi:iron complex transport system substrate-binding protein
MRALRSIQMLSLLVLAGCSGGAETRKGGIVSNNPCIDAILAEVADPGQISAISAYSHDPSAASAPSDWALAHPGIGMNAEDIITTRPRIVLTGNLASSGTNAALKKANINVLTYGVPKTVEESLIQIRDISAAISRRAAGDRLITSLTTATTLPAFARTGKKAIIWQAGGFVAGKNTVQDELLTRAGFQNASATYGLNQWDMLPLETIIRNPPDVIFMPVTGAGEAGRSLTSRLRLFRHLEGKTRIVDLPDKLLYCAGPSMAKVMRILRAAA